MTKKYSNEFKEQAVKRVLAGETAAHVARELGINENTLYPWVSKYKNRPDEPFVGSGNLYKEEAEMRAMKRRIKDL
jgi:transposase